MQKNFHVSASTEKGPLPVSASTSLMPIYQSSLQYDSCIPNHLVTRPVAKSFAPLEKLSPPEKCLGHIVCITIVFVVTCDVTHCYMLSM